MANTYFVLSKGCTLYHGDVDGLLKEVMDNVDAVRIGIIYLCSGFIGSLMSALFVQKIPEVGSSGALFGLLCAMLSGIIRNWKTYSDKFTALVVLCLVAAINLSLGLLPHVDNFSNVGGFLSGFILGFVLFFDPRVAQVPQNKKGLFEYNEKGKINFKQKLDKPVLRSISLILLLFLLLEVLLQYFMGRT